MLYEFMVLLLIILLVFLLLYTVIRRTKYIEHFYGTVITNSPTSAALYTQNSSSDFDNIMFKYRDVLSDRDSLLHMFGCGINLGTADRGAIDSMVEAAAGSIAKFPVNVLSNNYTVVNANILDIITKFYDTNKRKQIQGQIYVVLAQAPFYMDVNNNPVSLQFSYNNYQNRPVNVMTSAEKETNPQIEYTGYVIFTAYYKNGDLITDVNKRKKVILNIKNIFRQKENLCFISCPQNSGLPCGCASRDAPYISNCLESKNPSKMSSGERYTYAILYRVNPMFTDIETRDILVNDSRDIQWLQSKVANIPTIERPRLLAPYVINNTKIRNGVVFYQHCDYHGWKSDIVPPGKKYTMEELKNYGVREDMSAYKIYGNVKVQLYIGKLPVDVKKYVDGYLYGDMKCLTKYKDTNDKITSVDIQLQE